LPLASSVHNAAMDSIKAEIAAVAARSVVEEGLDFGAAKRSAAQQLGLSTRQSLPDHETMEQAVRDYIAIFCPESQAQELGVLRGIAMDWMERLSGFQPHLGGAVWRGTATRHSDIYLQLFCEDSKIAEITLIDRGVRFAASQVTGLHGETVDALSVQVWCEAFKSYIGLHLLVNDLDGIRGALQSDAQGRRWRGDAKALRTLMNNSSHAAIRFTRTRSRHAAPPPGFGSACRDRSGRRYCRLLVAASPSAGCRTGQLVGAPMDQPAGPELCHAKLSRTTAAGQFLGYLVPTVY
jgi:hypothetical protein